MKKLASVLLILLGTVVSASAQESAVASKRLNFAYVHGSPDYVDLSSLGGNVFPAGIDNQMVKARNLKSFAVNFRGWRLMDEYIVDPEFFWELDPTALKGRIRTVNYEKIAKYPSLEKRYKAIKPVGVNYIVCVDLNSTDQDGEAASSFRPHQVCFRAQSYQMFWGPSRSGRAASYPGALLGWKEGVSTASLASRFLASDNSDVNRLKNIVSKFRSVAKYSGSPTNTWLDIRWPDDAIDKIYEDFEEYEKEGKDLEKEYKEAKEEPKVAKRPQPLAADDDMAQPYEDVPKTAKVFQEGSVVGLITPKGKKVFSSDKHPGGAHPRDPEGRFFEFRLKEDKNDLNNKEMVTAAGKRLVFDGHARFHSIEWDKDRRGYTIFIGLGGPDVYRTTRCVDAPRTLTVDQFEKVQALDKGSSPGTMRGFYVPARHFYQAALRVLVDAKFRKVSSEPAYIRSGEESLGLRAKPCVEWPYEWN